MVGYFEGIASERGIAWRCSDLMSLRDFLRLENREEVPDHSWLSKTRGRLPHEVHETVFGWVLQLVAEQGLVKGKRIGVDASTMEANAALRTIVRLAGHNLGILMRLLIGAGTPREAAARGLAYLFFVYTEEAAAIILVAPSPNGFAILAVAVTADLA